jgi:hypothetical protein
MRTSPTARASALRAVAGRFAATLEPGKGPVDAYLGIAAERVALVVTAFASRAPRRTTLSRPRLRFDRGALRLIERLRTALSGSVPEGSTVVVTVTAPIRVPSRTTSALQEKIRRALTTRTAPARIAGAIHGNDIQVHILKGGSSRTTRLIGFVHNPDSDPTILIDVTRAVLERLGAGERTAGSRWLVIASEDRALPIEVCRHVCSQLGVAAVFGRVLAVLPGGRVESASG